MGRAARRRQVNRTPPGEFTGSPGLIGPYRNVPRLNPDLWEIAQNPKTGRYFGRPANELTGLPTWARRDIGGFDRRTEAQVGQINEAYTNYANLAAQDAAAGAANLGALAAGAGRGFTDTIAGSASGPYGSIAPVGLGQAERALPGVLSQGAREQSAAVSAQTIAGLNQLPTLARSEGGTVGATFRAGREDSRREQITAYRGQQQEGAAAEADARFKRQQLEATLQIATGEQGNTRRGQNLDFQTSAGDRAADLAKEAAKLRQEAQLAYDNNRLERWKTLTKRAEKKEKQAKKARGLRTVNRKVREQADRLIDHLIQGVPDPDSPGGLFRFTDEDIVDELIKEFDFSPTLARRFVARQRRLRANV